MSLLSPEKKENKIQQQAQTSVMIVENVIQVKDFLINRYNHVMRIFWKNPKLTPQEVADSLGTDAAELFTFGGALTSLILSVSPESAEELEVPLFDYSLNADGTVTIIPPPEPEPEPEPEVVNDPVSTPEPPVEG